MNREMVRHTRDGRVGSTLLEPELLESISDIGRDIYRSVRLSLSSSSIILLCLTYHCFLSDMIDYRQSLGTHDVTRPAYVTV